MDRDLGGHFIRGIWNFFFFQGLLSSPWDFYPHVLQEKTYCTISNQSFSRDYALHTPKNSDRFTPSTLIHCTQECSGSSASGESHPARLSSSRSAPAQGTTARARLDKRIEDMPSPKPSDLSTALRQRRTLCRALRLSCFLESKKIWRTIKMTSQISKRQSYR